MLCDTPYLQNELGDPRFVYVFNLILSFSICTWELLGANVLKYSTIFKTARVAKKIWRIVKTKYARIFVLGHYLFLVAHSFPRASFSETCSLLGTDNVRGQISVHIFAPNATIVYIFSRQMEATVYKYMYLSLTFYEKWKRRFHGAKLTFRRKNICKLQFSNLSHRAKIEKIWEFLL